MQSDYIGTITKIISVEHMGYGYVKYNILIRMPEGNQEERFLFKSPEFIGEIKEGMRIWKEL